MGLSTLAKEYKGCHSRNAKHFERYPIAQNVNKRMLINSR